MEIIDYLLARKKAGGGSDVTIEQLSVTENGTYSEQGKAYSPVVVNVPTPENSYQLKDLPTGTVSTIEDGTALPMSSLKVGIEPVQEGSGDPSPENIRPISGWTEANVVRSGKNILRLPTYEEIVTYPQTSGYYNIPIRVMPNTNYYLSTSYLNGYSSVGARMYVLISPGKDNREWKAIAHNTSGISNGTLTSSNEGYLYLNIVCNSPNDWNTLLDNVQTQLELGSTATTYEPYQGQTYNIQFKDGDNPLAVYGGTLDATTGELVVDRVKKTLNGTQNTLTNWTETETSIGWLYRKELVNVFNDIRGGEDISDLILSDYLPSITYWSAYGGDDDNGISIVPESNTWSLAVRMSKTLVPNAASINTYLALNPLAVVVKLAEPITYHLTPTQVRTLVGTNNIWADTGDVIEGNYFKALT